MNFVDSRGKTITCDDLEALLRMALFALPEDSSLRLNPSALSCL
jgi:hypothetical protein